MKEVSVTFDRTLDPEANIGREEELFRKVEAGELPELVRFWIDSRCLVRGKGKSPKHGWYHEDVAKKMGVQVVERITGGGVVYHDEGNLNWGFFLRSSGRLLSPAQMFEDASRHIIRTLEGLGVPAGFARPNRIDVKGYKVSGMAARSTPKAQLVHGTLLIDSDLELLNKLCIPPDGCPPVANISRWAGHVGAADVVRAFVKVLKGSGMKVRFTNDVVI